MTTQIKAGVIAANAITASELASSALSGGSFTGDVTFDTNTLVIDSSNNRVGIGTSSPSVPLEVAGNIFINTSGNPNLTVKTSGAGNNPYIRMQADTNYWDLQSTFSNTDDELFFMYNGSTKMAIDNGGFVGIGTDNPLDLLHINSDSTDARLVIDAHTGFDPEVKYAVNGTVKFTTGYDAGTDSFIIGTDNVDTNRRLAINASGNVLIGTTSTNANGLLQVNGSIGLLGTTEIRPATNLDTSSLSILSQNVIIGTLNSLAYSYSGGAQFASISSSGSKRVLDVGANSTSGHRLQVDNAANGVDGTLKYKSSTTSLFTVNSVNGRVGINTPDGDLSRRFMIQDSGDKTVTNFEDIVFIVNTQSVSGNYAQVAFSTNDSDGQHHRAAIRAYKDSRSSYGGVFQIRTRSTASPYDLDESLTVSALGEVTMPRQPMAMVDSNASWTTYTGGQAVIFNRAPINVGSCYNTSNGRFTAPVAGKYLVLVSMYTRAQNASSFTITLNGSQTGNSDVVPLLYRSQNGTVENTHVMQNLYDLSANDYLIIACRVSMGGTIYMGHSSASFIKVG